MVSIIVYLNEEVNPQELIHDLLTRQLVAMASVDTNNACYEISHGNLVKKVYSVVTMQTKSLLFREIADIIEERYGKETRITSLPIVSANRVFEEHIRSTTKQI